MKKKTVHLIVDLRDAREVQKLQARVRELEIELVKARERVNRSDFDLICQHRLNIQLQDYCREHGFKVPQRLFTLWRSSCEDDRKG